MEGDLFDLGEFLDLGVLEFPSGEIEGPLQLGLRFFDEPSDDFSKLGVLFWVLVIDRLGVENFQLLVEEIDQNNRYQIRVIWIQLGHKHKPVKPIKNRVMIRIRRVILVSQTPNRDIVNFVLRGPAARPNLDQLFVKIGVEV